MKILTASYILTFDENFTILKDGCIVEVHISNIYKREEFRQKSITAGSSTGVITGFGGFGYHLGLISLIQMLNELKALNDARNAQIQAQTQEENK